ncbi:hypothetical protein PoB_003079700 [Plakobranchus ocellatus]|uniref:Protein kinase domain-containing protein n=1 Tax=Plakobranchus ocellatus TaxID=259542 RepID=A0AAV4ABA7_9GAST|nr:hypothetical protein PoB_003079700 [Plakobranchus ocellatus]
MTTGWVTKLLNKIIQGKDRGAVCTAAKTLCTFLPRAVQQDARLSPGSYFQIKGRTDAFSLGAVLTCLLVGFDLTGHQRNDLHLLTDRPNWPHGPVFNMLRRMLQNLLNPIWQDRWDVGQLIRELIENHEWIHLTFELLPTSTRYGPPSRRRNLHPLANRCTAQGAIMEIISHSCSGLRCVNQNLQ